MVGTILIIADVTACMISQTENNSINCVCVISITRTYDLTDVKTTSDPTILQCNTEDENIPLL